ncbi:CGNR zinc finger domain-containing protein [Brevibacillus porteri]|uniref:CGNR zinc finger domain-containing protein n=1 Tax=Brevibacillus porteri TaxID=2126350 RepID=UPI003D1953A3
MDWLCIDFLNSDWRDWRGSGRAENRLENQEWLSSFLQTYKLTAPLPMSEDCAVSLLQLRERLRRMLEAVVRGDRFQEEDLVELNRALALAPFHMQVLYVDEEGGYRQNQSSSTEGWPLVMAQIASSFAELLAPQHLERIKICDNKDCRWVFYDESRNRVRRWCDDKMCGNLMKVRRFRERQKEKG